MRHDTIDPDPTGPDNAVQASGDEQVPFDPELVPFLKTWADQNTAQWSVENVPSMRSALAEQIVDPSDLVGDLPIVVEERSIPGPVGGPSLMVTILRPDDLDSAVPGLYNIHGGGMMLGHRHMDVPRLLPLVLELGVVAVSVEYRLTPEHPHPAPVEDCYAGLKWFAEHAMELRVDPRRILVMGGSAGGGLAAGVALLARDRQGPDLAGQLLLCPMIDDSSASVSSHQFVGRGTWPREANLVGWSALLGAGEARTRASEYAAPARATDLTDLPPAFIEVGSAELFRDEDVEYASRLWAVGGQAELHVWAGGCHGFDIYVPDAQISRAALEVRNSWLRRILGLTPR